MFRLPFVPQSRNPSSGIKLYWSALLLFFYFLKRKTQMIKYGIHFGQIWPYGMIGSIYRMIILDANHVFAYSSFVLDNVRKLLNGKLPGSINVFSIGMEPEIFCSNKWKYHEKFNPNKNEIVLFSVSRHIERKGFDTLIESVNLLNEKVMGWRLYIGGEGPLSGFLKRKVIEYNLEDNVVFLGLIDNRELHGCYRRADIFILPNRILDNGDADGCPIVFLEASSYSVPCIGGNVPGTKDAIVDGKTGFIVDSSNFNLLSEKIRFLIENKHERERIGLAARKFIESNYQWKERINKLGEINDKISN